MQSTDKQAEKKAPAKKKAAPLPELKTVPLLAGPALVVHGAYDTLCAPEAATWLLGHLPNARLALHPRASHAPFLSHPEIFVEQVCNFLKNN